MAAQMGAIGLKAAKARKLQVADAMIGHANGNDGEDMAALNRELRRRLRAWLDTLPINTGANRIGDRYTEEFSSFQELLLQTELGSQKRLLDRSKTFRCQI